VQSVDSVIIAGIYHKRWNFEQLPHNPPTWYIQGIGSSMGLIEPFYTYAFDFTTRFLVCLSDSSAPVYVTAHDSQYGCALIHVGIAGPGTVPSAEIWPIPIRHSATMRLSRPLDNATLQIVTLYGQIMFETAPVNGLTILLDRRNLKHGLRGVYL